VSYRCRKDGPKELPGPDPSDTVYYCSARWSQIRAECDDPDCGAGHVFAGKSDSNKSDSNKKSPDIADFRQAMSGVEA